MVRVANNEAARKCLELEAKGATLQELMPVISGNLAKPLSADGNVDGGMFAVGPAAGLIHEVEAARRSLTPLWQRQRKV